MGQTFQSHPHGALHGSLEQNVHNLKETRALCIVHVMWSLMQKCAQEMCKVQGTHGGLLTAATLHCTVISLARLTYFGPNLVRLFQASPWSSHSQGCRCDAVSMQVCHRVVSRGP